MEVEFSTHALERIKQRKISKHRVIQTINTPTKILSSSYERSLCRKQFGSKILEVVIKNEATKIIIITAYYLRSKNENKIRLKS